MGNLRPQDARHHAKVLEQYGHPGHVAAGSELLPLQFPAPCSKGSPLDEGLLGGHNGEGLPGACWENDQNCYT